MFIAVLESCTCKLYAPCAYITLCIIYSSTIFIVLDHYEEATRFWYSVNEWQVLLWHFLNVVSVAFTTGEWQDVFKSSAVQDSSEVQFDHHYDYICQNFELKMLCQSLYNDGCMSNLQGNQVWSFFLHFAMFLHVDPSNTIPVYKYNIVHWEGTCASNKHHIYQAFVTSNGSMQCLV